MFSFFLAAQHSGWYPALLLPIADCLQGITPKQQLLDIGTGPGKLPELLQQQFPEMQITGTDINASMLSVAKKRLRHTRIVFQLQIPGQPLGFSDQSFDVVTLCSVLFLLPETDRHFMMREAIRLLKPGGHILVLHPTGKRPLLLSGIEIWKFPFSIFNATYFIWRGFTAAGGKQWQQNDWLKKFAACHALAYHTRLVFNQNASLEIISKPTTI